MSGHAQAANTTNAPSKEFRFDGGSLRDFTRKLGQQFGSNFLEMLVIRDEDADRLQIPKIKNRFLGSDMASTDWTRVLKLYNQISEEGNGSMGKWIFSPEGPRWVSDGTNTFALPPETLVFVPPQPAGGVGGAIKVRAFPIRGMPKDRLVELQGIIEQESRRMQEDIASGRLPAGQDISLAQGRLSMHQGSELLIAVGGQSYVELVQAVVDAFFVNYPFMRSVPSPKPQ
jgi:hypothetical protein